MYERGSDVEEQSAHTSQMRFPSTTNTHSLFPGAVGSDPRVQPRRSRGLTRKRGSANALRNPVSRKCLVPRVPHQLLTLPGGGCLHLILRLTVGERSKSVTLLSLQTQLNVHLNMKMKQYTPYCMYVCTYKYMPRNISNSITENN